MQPRMRGSVSGGGLGLGSGSGYGSGQARLGGSHKAAGPHPAPSAAPSSDSFAQRRAAVKTGAPQQRAPGAPATNSARPPAQTPEVERPADDAGLVDWRDVQQGAGFGAAVYLSNDDTMSLSSAQRLIYAIEHDAPIRPEQVRPHELLNYFSFRTAPVHEQEDFSMMAEVAEHDEREGEVTLALAVRGRSVDKSNRRAANLNFVVDRSGSMAAEGRMEYLKRGLLRATEELKLGDVVNLTLFDDQACDLVSNFLVGRDSLDHLRRLIGRIVPRGSTNLHEGLTRGYASAERTYHPRLTNRVILVTDALTNTGILDEDLIAMVGEHHDRRRIRLSGVGVGRGFNDSLLDRLTERGRGAYVFLGSAAEVDAVFGERFVSLIETVASDVHFQLQLPPSLAMKTFYGEEASVDKERVQAIHYFAGTSQLFLADLVARPGYEDDDILIRAEYESPESGEARVEEFVFRLGEARRVAHNLDKARLISDFARGVAGLAQAGFLARAGGLAGSISNDPAAVACSQLLAEVRRRATPLSSDPEVRRVVDLTSTLCRRYAPPSRVVPTRRNNDDSPGHTRNNDYAPDDTWPGAR